MAAGASQLPTAMAYQSQLIIKHWERQTDLARTSAPTSPPLPQGSLSPPPHHALLQGALVSAPPFLRHSEWGWGSTQPQSPPHSLPPLSPPPPTPTSCKATSSSHWLLPDPSTLTSFRRFHPVYDVRALRHPWWLSGPMSTAGPVGGHYREGMLQSWEPHSQI